MKSATVHEIKDELVTLKPNQLVAICLRLAKFKKENKELLTYLLFEAGNESGYLQSVKMEVDASFAEINRTNLYFAKKTIRKILRQVNKYIRYTGSRQAEVELILHFCRALHESGIPYQDSTALNNLYQAQLKKISKTLSTLHEDIQYDYSKELESLI